MPNDDTPSYIGSGSPPTVDVARDLSRAPQLGESAIESNVSKEAIKLQAQAIELKLQAGTIALDKERLKIEQEKAALEQQKLLLQQEHLAIKRKETETERSPLRHPIVLAAIAASVGWLGNAITGVINGDSQHTLEEQKSESQRIENALQTGLNNPDKAAENLAFLADVGLLDSHAKGVRDYLSKRKIGQGPSFAAPAVERSGTTPLYYSCRSDSDCVSKSMCIDQNHDMRFYCKPLCATDSDCAGNKYGETVCGVLGKNGNPSASGKRFCLAQNDPNGVWTAP